MFMKYKSKNYFAYSSELEAWIQLTEFQKWSKCVINLTFEEIDLFYT